MCAEPNKRRARSRWFQFSLRTLMLVVTGIIGLLVAWRIYIEPFQQQAAAMKRIEALGGSYQSETGGPAWLRGMLGNDRFQDVTHANLADCDEPDQYIGHIARLRRLRTLVVGGKSFNDAHLKRLHSLHALQGLVLDTTGVSEEGIALLQTKVPNLTVHQSHRRAIAALEAKKQLVQCEKADAPVALYDAVGEGFLRRILSVSPPFGFSAFGTHYSNSELTDADLFQLKGIRSLESLDLRGGDISDASLPILATLGNLKELNVSSTKITKLAPLVCLTGLRSLSLDRCQVPSAELKHLNNLPSLGKLGFSQTFIGDGGTQHLSVLVNLEELDITGAEITDQGLRHVAALTNLRRLLVFENRITDQGLPYLYGMSHLEFLGLARSGPFEDMPARAFITATGEQKLKQKIPGLEIYGLAQVVDSEVLQQRIAAVRDSRTDRLDLSDFRLPPMEQIAGLSNLKSLNLSGTVVDDEGLRYVKSLANLEDLNLRDSWVTDTGLEHIAHSGRLKELILYRTRVTDAGLRHLAKLRNLERLSLADAPVTGAGLSYLAGCDRLQYLTLEFSSASAPSTWPSIRSHPGVTKEGLRAIGALGGLQTLVFNGPQITDDDLAPLASLENLKALRIYQTQIHGRGLRCLRDLKNLRVLYLYDNALTDEAIEHLATLENLKRIELGRDHISADGLQRLRAVLPNTCQLDVN